MLFLFAFIVPLAEFLEYFRSWEQIFDQQIFDQQRGCLRGVMVKAMDCGVVVREFVLQSRYNVHFRANTFGKGMNPLILPAMGQIVPLLFF